MKISYNWLKEYISCDLSPEKIGEVLTAIGLEVEAIEKVEAIPGGLKGVVVGHVLTCEKHPDADRLRITTVDVGAEAPLQIVCGAPNVAVGQKVLVATVGTQLYPTSGDSFQIKKSKIRGVESIGMICAEDELGLGESHDGIMILDESAVIGTHAATQLSINEDYCMEIGLTPNRTDAFSHYGVARDLAAALENMEGIERTSFSLKFPEIPQIEKSTSSSVKIEVENNEDCARYAGAVMTGVKIEPSPKWLQERLSVIGLRPINNVVDITNFIQHEMGQPLHAFDLNKIEGQKVVVRRAKEGEEFISLDNVTRKLYADDLMICDAQKPMCIAGVFGGADSGVSDDSTSIFIESAYFNSVVVRKTAKRHALHTDASFRFERGADPMMAIPALQRAVQMISEIAGGKLEGGYQDVYPSEIQKKQVVFTWKNATKLIGQEIPKDHIKAIFKSLEMQILQENEEGVTLSIPYYRVDVTREADVIEEVLRMYGFNNIDFPRGLNSSLSYAPKPDAERLQNKVADVLASSGFNEIMGMSLTKMKYAQLIDEPNYHSVSAVELLNPLSQDLGIMRQSLVFGGLESIELNQNHKQPDLRLFEFGKVYHKIEGKYIEEYKLGLWLTGRRNPESWNTTGDSVSFIDAKHALENIFRSMGIQGTVGSAYDSALFEDAMEYGIGKKKLARLGKINASIQKTFDIKQAVYYVELDWTTLIESQPKKAIQYKPAEKFPAVRRDLSLLLDQTVKFGDIEKTAFDAERKLLRQVGLFDVYEGKNLEAGKKSYAISFTLQDSSKTMTDQQVDQAMERVRKALDEKLGAKVRS